MPNRVLHVALTPLAGSPVRIVNALNRHTEIHARLVVLSPDAYGNRTFAEDLNWQRDKEELLDLLSKIDILHLHHFFELENNSFGVNFRDVCGKQTRFIRQYHSTPMTIARGDSTLARSIVCSDVPKLVIAQYPERYFPKARLVPNIVPLDDELYLPRKDHNGAQPVIFFSPSRDEPAWSVQPGQTRWDTKGALETERLLKKVVTDCRKGRAIVRRNIPHDQCLRERQASDISIDEMVTGSFHLASLEALAQGLPTFAYLDARTLETLAELTGTHMTPWLNFRLEEAEGPLVELIKDVELRREIGAFARNWMEKYYNDREMVKHYVRAYEDLLERPEGFKKMRFEPSSKRMVWLAQRRDDLTWESRKERVGSNPEPLRPVSSWSVTKTPIMTLLARKIKRCLQNLSVKQVGFHDREIRSFQESLQSVEETLEFVAADEMNRWLYANRQERMDATVPIFEQTRRQFHIERYRFAARRVEGQCVLDCACGTGYGVRLLKEVGKAAGVIGVELNKGALEYAGKKHQLDSIHYLCASGDCMPLPDGCVDVVTSFETIEHVPDDVALIEEFSRVLRSDGLLIISTPNQWPVAVSPFHVREYDRDSFLRVVETGFECLELYNQNSGSNTPYNHGQTAGVVVTTEDNKTLAECYLAVCRRRSKRGRR